MLHTGSTTQLMQGLRHNLLGEKQVELSLNSEEDMI